MLEQLSELEKDVKELKQDVCELKGV